MVPEKEVAAYILGLLTHVSVPATDQDLNNALAARQWLGAFVSGSLVALQSRSVDAA